MSDILIQVNVVLHELEYYRNSETVSVNNKLFEERQELLDNSHDLQYQLLMYENASGLSYVFYYNFGCQIVTKEFETFDYNGRYQFARSKDWLCYRRTHNFVISLDDTDIFEHFIYFLILYLTGEVLNRLVTPKTLACLILGIGEFLSLLFSWWLTLLSLVLSWKLALLLLILVIEGLIIFLMLYTRGYFYREEKYLMLT